MTSDYWRFDWLRDASTNAVTYEMQDNNTTTNILETLKTFAKMMKARRRFYMTSEHCLVFDDKGERVIIEMPMPFDFEGKGEKILLLHPDNLPYLKERTRGLLFLVEFDARWHIPWPRPVAPKPSFNYD